MFLMFFVPNVHRNTSGGSRVKKKIRSGKHNVFLWARKLNNQNIQSIMQNYQNFIYMLKDRPRSITF